MALLHTAIYGRLSISRCQNTAMMTESVAHNPDRERIILIGLRNNFIKDIRIKVGKQKLLTKVYFR